MMKKPHVVAVPFPGQGHVTPLMKLSRRIARRGIKVTFVNTHSIHAKILASSKSLQDQDEIENDNFVLTSIPDGRLPEDDENDTFILLERLRSTMPGSLADLISRINGSDCNHKVTSVIADISIISILETARSFGAEPVIFSPPSAASFASISHVFELLEEGRLDSNGSLRTGEVIALSGDIPTWKENELPWNYPSDLNVQRIFFECTLRAAKAGHEVKWLLCNTCYELESAACDLSPNLLPIGPLIEFNNCHSNFHSEDETSLTWLDSKPPGSVVYVSFGSTAMFSQQQLDELAFGLELSNRAFLWVARPDLASGSPVVYPDGFLERIKGLGKIVTWAPQEKVLSHRATACFLSHCGWNSTLEGVSNGIPILCWPYFADQVHNQSYVCDKWGIGLRIEADENKIRTRDEIRTKIGMMFCDYKFKENAMKLKELCSKSAGEGGSSYNNFEMFIDSLKTWK